MTTKLVLYAAPGSCSKVAMILLEEIGEPYQLELVKFMKGEHKSPAYRKINPKGKVPVLVANDSPISENPIIISYLNDQFPEANILPKANAADRYQQLSDLCFCSSTLHPIVTRIRMPQMFTDKQSMASVWQKGCDAMDEYFQLIENRLHNNEWWYGSQWSAVDAYIYWIFWRVAGANYDVSRYPNFFEHFSRMEQRSSVKVVTEKEAEMETRLKKEGLLFVPPKIEK